MKRLILVLLATWFTVWGIQAIAQSNEDTRHQNVYYRTGQVVSIGQCKNGECSYQFKNADDQIVFAVTRDPVSIGQLVYQECWYENAKGNQCYVEYQASKN